MLHSVLVSPTRAAAVLLACAVKMRGHGRHEAMPAPCRTCQHVNPGRFHSVADCSDCTNRAMHFLLAVPSCTSNKAAGTVFPDASVMLLKGADGAPCCTVKLISGSAFQTHSRLKRHAGSRARSGQVSCGVLLLHVARAATIVNVAKGSQCGMVAFLHTPASICH